MDEKRPEGAQELNDEELSHVSGGQTWAQDGDKYYHYVGTSSDADYDASYLCPNCGRPVHYGAGWRYYCDPCDESWYWEDKLRINTHSGVWEEITAREYSIGRYGLRDDF